ncbi:MAG TPA: hypothetical protein VH601_06805 [Bryobacteraceae bacterium]|jgi:hypothetical protein
MQQTSNKHAVEITNYTSPDQQTAGFVSGPLGHLAQALRDIPHGAPNFIPKGPHKLSMPQPWRDPDCPCADSTRAIIRNEASRAPTLFLGDGINDAPAMQAATVGIAFGQNSDVTAEAADAVVMESSLSKVDELIHIGQRMRRIALESAVGGMVLSMLSSALCRRAGTGGD